MSTTEQSVNIKSVTLRSTEKGYGKAAMKKTQVYKWHKGFRDGVRMSMTIITPGDRQLRQMTKTSSECVMLCEMTNKRAFKRCHQK
jgi:hypothetical protein